MLAYSPLRANVLLAAAAVVVMIITVLLWSVAAKEGDNYGAIAEILNGFATVNGDNSAPSSESSRLLPFTFKGGLGVSPFCPPLLLLLISNHE